MPKLSKILSHYVWVLIVFIQNAYYKVNSKQKRIEVCFELLRYVASKRMKTHFQHFLSRKQTISLRTRCHVRKVMKSQKKKKQFHKTFIFFTLLYSVYFLSYQSKHSLVWHYFDRKCKFVRREILECAKTCFVNPPFYLCLFLVLSSLKINIHISTISIIYNFKR